MELPSLHPQDHDAAADAATLNSDAAVVADGMGGAASDGDHAPPPAGAAAVSQEGRHPRHRPRRKRALSAAAPLDYAGDQVDVAYHYRCEEAFALYPMVAVQRPGASDTEGIERADDWNGHLGRVLPD